jgi:uncharacterized protein YkwD
MPARSLDQRFPRRTPILLISLLGLLTLSGANCGSSSSPRVQSSISAIVDPTTVTPVAGSATGAGVKSHPRAQTNDLYELVIQERANSFLTVVLWNNRLGRCVFRHNEAMVAHNFFSLVAPNGVDVFERIADTSGPSYNPTAAQYFIAQGTDDAAELFDYLMSNRTTYSIIKNPIWTSFAAAYDPAHGGTWTIAFSN